MAYYSMDQWEAAGGRPSDFYFGAELTGSAPATPAPVQAGLTTGQHDRLRTIGFSDDEILRNLQAYHERTGSTGADVAHWGEQAMNRVMGMPADPARERAEQNQIAQDMQRMQAGNSSGLSGKDWMDIGKGALAVAGAGAAGGAFSGLGPGADVWSGWNEGLGGTFNGGAAPAAGGGNMFWDESGNLVPDGGQFDPNVDLGGDFPLPPGTSIPAPRLSVPGVGDVYGSWQSILKSMPGLSTGTQSLLKQFFSPQSGQSGGMSSLGAGLLGAGAGAALAGLMGDNGENDAMISAGISPAMQYYQQQQGRQAELEKLASEESNRQLGLAGGAGTRADDLYAGYKDVGRPMFTQTAMDAMGSEYLSAEDRQLLANIYSGTSGLNGSGLVSAHDAIAQRAGEGAAGAAGLRAQGAVNSATTQAQQALARFGGDPNQIATRLAKMSVSQGGLSTNAQNSARADALGTLKGLRTGVSAAGMQLPGMANSSAALSGSLGTNAVNTRIAAGQAGMPAVQLATQAGLEGARINKATPSLLGTAVGLGGSLMGAQLPNNQGSIGGKLFSSVFG